MVKRATNTDCRILAELAIEMWESHTLDELEKDFFTFTNSEEAACFIAYSGEVPIGFSQCGLRKDYVEGAKDSPVGYLEGVFVKEKYRKKGYGKELVHACEKWAKNKGCFEFASDCELTNTDSIKFHSAMSFEEANRIICFIKNI